MNKLQIIEEIFGDKFCPVIQVSYTTNYSAQLRDVNESFCWQSPSTLKEIIRMASEYGARIGVDLVRQQYDIYFND